MKLVWSPDLASKAYIDTVKYCKNLEESGVAELVSAMAAGWNAKLIVETWSRGRPTATSIGLRIASDHTGARHVCVVPNERSRSAYCEAIAESEARLSPPEVIVGEAEEAMGRLEGIDFLVVDFRERELGGALKVEKLSDRGAVLVRVNASPDAACAVCWRSAFGERLKRLVFLPVGSGVDIAHVAAPGRGLKSGRSKWIRHVDRASGEEHLIRR